MQVLLQEYIWCIGHEKKKPCFTGRRTFQVGSVGRDIFFFFLIFFFLSGGKNDSPKNNKSSKKSDIFWRKILENNFQLFPKIFSHCFFVFFFSFDFETLTSTQIFFNFDPLLKKGKKKKKKTYQKWKSGSVAPVKQGFLFLWPYPT